MSLFSRGDRIYPNLQALDATLGEYHNWRWTPRYTGEKRPIFMVRRVMKGGSNGIRGPVYQVNMVQYDQEWVEKHFWTQAEHVAHLLTVASTVNSYGFPSEAAIVARNELMDIGDELTVEVSAIHGNDYSTAFEALLDSWKKYGYRPTLSVRVPKDKMLADIYDLAQKVRGVDVVAFRSNG